jgi:hypothetical protein
MGVPLGLLALLDIGWAQLAPIRAASGQHGFRSAMSEAAQLALTRGERTGRARRRDTICA